MQMSGSQIIVKCLLRQGVDIVFGYPGAAIMPLYDALYEAPIRHILTVHEQGAAHAADGYARSSGKVGVCIATSGPGATNLVTGLATAFMDSSPVVAITGQVATQLLGHDAFQEIDITGVTMPITKHNFLVKDIRNLADTVNKAFAIAASGRPGPVLIDIPRDILLAQGQFSLSAEPDSDAPTRLAEDVPCQQAVTAAVAALLTAKRPVMIVGGGVKAGEAHQEAIALAALTEIPVVSTLMGLGVFPASFSHFLGLTGMHGHKSANWAVCEADVILAVGTRFSDRVTGDRSSYASGKTIIHLDVDPSEINKNIVANITIMGNLRQALQQITDLLRQTPSFDGSEWRQTIDAWRQKFYTSCDTVQLNPRWIMQYMSGATAGKPVIWVTDVGQHQMWAAQHLQIHGSRCWLSSGGLGTMGFGLPAALGAQAACPDKRVILIAGDGGFKMSGMELYTAVHERLPVISIILNNQVLGMVRQWQTLFFEQRYAATTLPSFDFVAFAHACTASATSVSTPREFETAFQQALHSGEPSVIVANIDQDALVDPMVYPGRPINQFVAM
jgi:acetolactate synthase-1/2/3 large subunit